MKEQLNSHTPRSLYEQDVNEKLRSVLQNPTLTEDEVKPAGTPGTHSTNKTPFTPTTHIYQYTDAI